MWLIDDSLFGLRCSAALLGVLAVVPLFLLLRHWWRDGLAVLITLACVSNHWFLFLCHSGVHYVQALFFAMLLLGLLVLANHTREIAFLLLAGVAMGFALMSYQANHILPVVWIASQVVWWITQRTPVRAFLIATVVPLAMALLVIAPLLVHEYQASQRVDAFTQRAQSVSIFSPPNWAHLDDVYEAEGSAAIILWNQVQRSVLAPVAVVDSSGQFGGSMPMLDRLLSMLFVLGCAVSLLRLRDERMWIPLLWLAAILLPGAVLLIDTPFYPRLAGTTFLWYFPVALLASIAMQSIPKGIPRSVGFGALAMVVCISSAIHLHQFFVVYRMVDDPTNIHFAQTRLARFVEQQPPQNFVYVFDGAMGLFGSGTVRFLAPEARGEDITSLDSIADERIPFVLILAPHHRDELAQMLARYPEAEVERYHDGFDLVCYEVRVLD